MKKVSDIDTVMVNMQKADGSGSQKTGSILTQMDIELQTDGLVIIT